MDSSSSSDSSDNSKGTSLPPPTNNIVVVENDETQQQQQHPTIPECDLTNLQHMEDDATCKAPWSIVRNILHPSQEAVGYAEIKRKIHKQFDNYANATLAMEKTSNWLPFVSGPYDIPYLVDSHHTASAIEATGYHSINVILKKICDWNHLKSLLSTSESQDDDNNNDDDDDNVDTDDEMALFYETMIKHNFMLGIGRYPNDDLNSLPVVIHPSNISKSIPSTIPQLKDDPWRSFASLVRHVKDKEHEICPPDNELCLRGYYRQCQSDGTLTFFFEFRWAYFLNDAYIRGCGDDTGDDEEHRTTSFWDDPTECQKFNEAYQAAMLDDDDDDDTCDNEILNQHRKRYKKAAEKLIPLCRGKKAQHYKLPKSLGIQLGGGQNLPGRIPGRTNPIRHDDPKCTFPKCPAATKMGPSGKFLVDLSLSSWLDLILIFITIFLIAFALGYFTANIRGRKGSGRPFVLDSYHTANSDDDDDDDWTETEIELTTSSSNGEQTQWRVDNKYSRNRIT